MTSFLSDPEIILTFKLFHLQFGVMFIWTCTCSLMQNYSKPKEHDDGNQIVSSEPYVLVVLTCSVYSDIQVGGSAAIVRDCAMFSV
jgi:hypothetical protein